MICPLSVCRAARGAGSKGCRLWGVLGLGSRPRWRAELFMTSAAVFQAFGHGAGPAAGAHARCQMLPKTVTI
jgi:hypothetical protein